VVKKISYTAFIVAVACTLIYATPESVSYFGGSGDDDIRSAVFAPQGDIILAGKSTSPSLANTKGEVLEDGDGFIARISSDGTQLIWLVRLGIVEKVKCDDEGTIFAQVGSTVKVISSDGSKILRTIDGFESKIVSIDLSPDGTMAVLAGGKVHSVNADGSIVWTRNVGRSHPLDVAINPTNNEIWVGGDQNTNTGREPWRSPFLFQYDAETGENKAMVWDWPGPATRENGRTLMADSFVRFLKFDRSGTLWIGAGSDGGNTVLMKEPDNLDVAQDGLEGSCFSGACFGYKGAKKTGLFARMTADGTDMERASWVVPYVNIAPGEHVDPPCGCKGGDFNGSGVNPGSFAVSAVLPIDNGVIVLGNPWGDAPVTENGFYYNTVYPGGGIGWMGVFSEDLSSISQASMLPGTRDAFGDWQDGTVLIAGKSQDFSSVTLDDAEKNWHIELPTEKSSLQPQFVHLQNR